MIDPQGRPLMGAATPPEVLEYPLDPKISADLKAAIKADEDEGDKLAQYGIGFLVMLADAIGVVNKKRATEEERARMVKRAEASSGIHKDQILGFEPDRGMLKYVKKVKNAQPNVTADAQAPGRN